MTSRLREYQGIEYQGYQDYKSIRKPAQVKNTGDHLQDQGLPHTQVPVPSVFQYSIFHICILRQFSSLFLKGYLFKRWPSGWGECSPSILLTGVCLTTWRRSTARAGRPAGENVFTFPKTKLSLFNFPTTRSIQGTWDRPSSGNGRRQRWQGRWQGRREHKHQLAGSARHLLGIHTFVFILVAGALNL